MGVSIIGQKVPLSRIDAVQISDNENDPKSWFKCKPNAAGANGYWMCGGHPKYDENKPIYFRIESIDKQVLIDEVREIEPGDESKFIDSVRGVQFKGCQERSGVSNPSGKKFRNRNQEEIRRSF